MNLHDPEAKDFRLPYKETDAQKVDRLYRILCLSGTGVMCDCWDCVHERVKMVGKLEEIIGKPFRNTAEFHYLVGEYLKKRSGKTTGQLIKVKRRAAKWTQTNLADHLGVTKRTVINYESNATPPTKRLLEWLNADGGHMGEGEIGGIVGQTAEKQGFSYGEK